MPRTSDLRRPILRGLLGAALAMCTASCVDDDPDAQWTDDDDGAVAFREYEAEAAPPADPKAEQFLVIESVEFGPLMAPNPNYAECPVCGRIVARGRYYVDVELEVLPTYKFSRVSVGLIDAGVQPATLDVPSSTGWLLGRVRLKSSIALPDDAELRVVGELR